MYIHSNQQGFSMVRDSSVRIVHGRHVLYHHFRCADSVEDPPLGQVPIFL